MSASDGSRSPSPTRKATRKKEWREEAWRKGRVTVEVLGARNLPADEDVSDDGGGSPPAVGHPADDTTVFLSSADEGRVELFDFDGCGDELEPTSPPRGASEPAG